jgi:hypothetical protein
MAACRTALPPSHHPDASSEPHFFEIRTTMKLAFSPFPNIRVGASEQESKTNMNRRITYSVHSSLFLRQCGAGSQAADFIHPKYRLSRNCSKYEDPERADVEARPHSPLRSGSERLTSHSGLVERFLAGGTSK